jgi:release factor glutamine methyltransferase
MFRHIKEQLQDRYSESEIKSFYYLIMKSVCRLDKHAVLLGKDAQILPEEKHIIEKIIEDLKKFRPIQYILGETEFYGLKFKVNEHVLIPRPETEELVEHIVSRWPLAVRSPFTVLDIGTGSGCIAVALSKFLSGSEVYASDISEKALEVALCNARHNQADVRFVRHDIFDAWPDSLPPQSVLVSNPPYVTPEEKGSMSKNVLDYEPHQALFVPQEKPLLFYERIADVARERLKANGLLYFETNEAYGQNAAKMLRNKGFEEVRLFRDIAGKERILVACAGRR